MAAAVFLHSNKKDKNINKGKCGYGTTAFHLARLGFRLAFLKLRDVKTQMSPGRDLRAEVCICYQAAVWLHMSVLLRLFCSKSSSKSSPGGFRGRSDIGLGERRDENGAQRDGDSVLIL